ncbi:Uma2 family endonuclease [Thiothrix lacustris]|uniref:Uma2 family endonuclease n=1 Tax=Thiothrix lacustris TaxID=525917 RepID=A0ABY9MPS4_9GAMM|nr:Uma2 family endonuclease [Thiothrix lacustris]WML89851.1 Uma2 family endonuclease [Thiothrix lacustris]
MSAIAQQCQLNYVSEGDYLEGEKHSEVRHEYVDGQVYAMAGTTKRHNEIAVNISTALRIASRGSLCKVYSSAVKVRAIGRKAFYYQNSRNAHA